MRIQSIFWVATFAILSVPEAHAQYGGDLGPPREHREHPPTHADSMRTLAGRWQLWGHLGFGWLASPSAVRSRYNAGVDVGVSGDRRFSDRLALRARIEYHDLASKQPRFIDANGYPIGSLSDYGHGWFGSALAGGAVRTWNHLWLEGAGGVGHFESGFSGQSYVDPVTLKTLPLRGRSGEGAAWAVGARYEFQPTLRARLLSEVQFFSMDRDGITLQFWAVRVGYRAH